MKFKVLFIAFTFVAALALVSCGGNPKPTGDPKKDAKAYVERLLYFTENINSIEDAKKADEESDKLMKEFEEAYKDKPEDLAKFKAEVLNLMMGDYKEKFESALEKAKAKNLK